MGDSCHAPRDRHHIHISLLREPSSHALFSNPLGELSTELSSLCSLVASHQLISHMYVYHCYALTRRVAAPVAPGQPLPSPRRNPTRRSLPPTPRFLGPSQSPGSTSSSAPFSGPAAPPTPAFPSSSPLLPGAATPDSLQLAPDSPSPVTRPGRARLAGQPRLRGAPETLGAASDRVSGAGPHRARAATPPSSKSKMPARSVPPAKAL